MSGCYAASILTVAEKSLVPQALTACTLKMYHVPRLSPVTVN